MRTSLVSIFVVLALGLTIFVLWPIDQPSNLVAVAMAEVPMPATPRAVKEINAKEEAEALLRKQLVQRVSLDFNDTPLQEVAHILAEQLIIQIVLDLPRLEEVGITTDSLISYQVRNVTGLSALKLMLEKYGLGYVVRDEVLLITSLEAAENELVIRVYNVSDLIQKEATRTSPTDKQEAANQNASDSSATIPTTRLEEIISNSVEPNSWSMNGSTGTIYEYNGLLIVAQNERIQKKIAELLAMMREAVNEPRSNAH
jgi:hypothetical protein